MRPELTSKWTEMTPIWESKSHIESDLK